ncbi:MAG: aminotransferase class V-fold PLP-dependent enzyme [Clostridium sp.]|uniref:aminotransferase class V-fold PLP-dependent enzyme n=1 Tax=Clostridium sp. TaxID=1506 RepID=UPI003F3B0591
MGKNKNTLREEFLGVESKILLPNQEYKTAINFDNAATTPPLKNVMSIVTELIESYGSIGRGTGQKQAISTENYEKCREYILSFFNVPSKKDYTAIFVNNTTDGINRIANTLLCERGIVLSTRMEHHSNDLPWRKNAFVDYIEVDSLGRLDYSSLNEKLEKYKGKFKFLTVTGASNVTGYVNDIHRIAKLVHKAGGKIVVDGAQLVPHMKINMKGFEEDDYIDFLVFSGHKIYAPFGSGVVIGPKDDFNKSCPDKQGGGIVELVKDWDIKYLETPERNEAGTPNYFGVVSLVAALKEIDKIGYDRLLSHEKELFNYLNYSLSNFKNIKIYGDTVNTRDKLGICVFNLDGIYHMELAKFLSRTRGIAARHGWFCAHPYCRRLMNLSEDEVCKFLYDENEKMPGMLRISLGPYNTREEVDILLEGLEEVSKKK